MNESVIHSREISFLEKVEIAIVDGLKAGVDGSVKVDAFPADPDDYDFAGLKAAVLVHYSGSQYTPPNGPADTSQMRRMTYSIALLARELRGQGGAYTNLEDVRKTIQGQVFNGAGPAQIIRDQLVSEVKGKWRWDISIALGAPAVARERLRPTGLIGEPNNYQIANNGV